MADHYMKTVEVLDQVARLETELAAAYRQNPRRPEHIAGLHQQLDRLLKVGSIHSQLAIAQAYQDQRLSA